MKKLILLLAAVLLISGAAWAQSTLPDPNAKPGSAIGTLYEWDVSAVDTVSTESRYSAGIFGNYIDDFVDVTYYDPNVGTFAFLGGYPADGDVASTDYLGYWSRETNSTGQDPIIKEGTQLSVGFAKTFSSFYLGVYYGGNLVTAQDKYTDVGATGDTDETWSDWANKLAVLVGTPGFGAFRLDVVMMQTTNSTVTDDNLTSRTRTTAPSFGLTWGGIKLAGMDPFVKVNYKFPNKNVWGTSTGTYYDVVYTYGSTLAVEAGINYDLDETSSVKAMLIVGGAFSSKVKGTGTFTNNVGTPQATPNLDDKTGGVFGFGLTGSYKKTLDFGQVAVGFEPVLMAGYTIDNTSDTYSTTDVDRPSNNNLEAAAAVNIGVKV